MCEPVRGPVARPPTLGPSRRWWGGLQLSEGGLAGDQVHTREPGRQSQANGCLVLGREGKRWRDGRRSFGKEISLFSSAPGFGPRG